MKPIIKHWVACLFCRRVYFGHRDLGVHLRLDHYITRSHPAIQ